MTGFREHTTSPDAWTGAVARLPPIARQARRRGLAAGRRLARQPDHAARAARGNPAHTRMPPGRGVDQPTGARRPAAQDVMVLSRKRAGLLPMQDELRALHIPAQQGEKTDLIELLRSAGHGGAARRAGVAQHDLVAGARAASPLFGLDDDVLVRWPCCSAGSPPRPGSSCCCRARTCRVPA
jgi:ATP-dependent helicase/nuclease subunit A